MKTRLALILWLAPIVLTAAADVRAQSWGSWTFTWENDSFALFNGSDEYYTNGVRLGIARAPGRNYKWAENLGKSWGRKPFTGIDSPVVATSLVMGQNLYTPEIITTFDVNPRDRPYAAWLYGGIRIDVYNQEFKLAHSFEGALGVIGPPALGEQTQTGVHLLRQNRIPKGWDHQIPAQLGISFLYDLRRQFQKSFMDAVPNVGLMFGNIQIYPTVGLTVRAGHHISGMPVTVIAPSAFRRPSPTKFEIYAFAGADGRCMLYNVFLDGSLVGGGPSVEREPWVYDLRYGLSSRVKTWRFTLTLVRRSEEFPPPPGRAEGLHDFGSIAISYEPQ